MSFWMAVMNHLFLSFTSMFLLVTNLYLFLFDKNNYYCNLRLCHYLCICLYLRISSTSGYRAQLVHLKRIIHFYKYFLTQQPKEVNHGVLICFYVGVGGTDLTAGLNYRLCHNCLCMLGCAHACLCVCACVLAVL